MYADLEVWYNDYVVQNLSSGQLQPPRHIPELTQEQLERFLNFKGIRINI